MKTRENITAGSFDWAVVREALRRSMPPVAKPSWKPGKPSTNRDLDISVLLNDVFGGEILRTQKGRGWHFYNRINDECVDLALQEGDDYTFGKSSATSEDTTGIYEQIDYTTFFTRFVTALEEAVGLGKYRPA